MIVERSEEALVPQIERVETPEGQGGQERNHGESDLGLFGRHGEQAGHQRHGPAAENERVARHSRDDGLDHLQVLHPVDRAQGCSRTSLFLRIFGRELSIRQLSFARASSTHVRKTSGAATMADQVRQTA